MHNQNDLGIYIHIPFCVQKCAYCDFLSFPADEAVREHYVQALCREIETAGERLDPSRGKDGPARVVSVFVGGGTPSILEPDQLRRILESVATAFPRSAAGKEEREPRCAGSDALRGGCAEPALFNRDVEVSVECNPGTLTPEKLSAMSESGVNRLSIGLQSADDAELACLGRIHDRQSFEASYGAAVAAGFSNINIDLMSALPGQSVESWRQTLAYVTSLTPPPTHISAYSLIIEEDTPFYERYHEADAQRARGGDAGPERAALQLPSEEEERQMYRLTRRLLGERGYERYEISNYARPGYACKHNLGYWQRRDYLGFGLGAASCFRETRWSNTRSLRKYLEIFLKKEVCADAREDIMHLTAAEQVEETVFLGLRMTKGIDLEAFAARFGFRLEERYARQIRRLRAEGIARVWDSHLRLTQKGMDLEGYAERVLLL